MNLLCLNDGDPPVAAIGLNRICHNMFALVCKHRYAAWLKTSCLRLHHPMKIAHMWFLSMWVLPCFAKGSIWISFSIQQASSWLTGSQQSNWPCRFILKTWPQQYYFVVLHVNLTDAQWPMWNPPGFMRKRRQIIKQGCFWVNMPAICSKIKNSACKHNMHECLTCTAKVSTRTHAVTNCITFFQLLHWLQACSPFKQLPITFTFTCTWEPDPLQPQVFHGMVVFSDYE